MFPRTASARAVVSVKHPIGPMTDLVIVHFATLAELHRGQETLVVGDPCGVHRGHFRDRVGPLRACT